MSHYDGFVYFIASANGRVKIGRSKRPEERLNDLQTGSSVRLEMIAAIPSTNSAKTERQLHELFADRHADGEWFLLSEADIGRAILYARGIEEWFMRINGQRLFTEEEVSRILKKRLAREKEHFQSCDLSSAKAKSG